MDLLSVEVIQKEIVNAKGVENEDDDDEDGNAEEHSDSIMEDGSDDDEHGEGHEDEHHQPANMKNHNHEEGSIFPQLVVNDDEIDY